MACEVNLMQGWCCCHPSQLQGQSLTPAVAQAHHPQKAVATQVLVMLSAHFLHSSNPLMHHLLLADQEIAQIPQHC
jgi:hypothetical protein